MRVGAVRFVISNHAAAERSNGIAHNAGRTLPMPPAALPDYGRFRALPIPLLGERV